MPAAGSVIFISLKNVILQRPVIAENLEVTGCSHFTNFKANDKARTCKLPSLSGPAGLGGEGLAMHTVQLCPKSLKGPLTLLPHPDPGAPGMGLARSKWMLGLLELVTGGRASEGLPCP